MKKVMSSIVAALVAVSFAGIVCAAEPAAPAMPAGHPPVADKAPAKPAKKVRNLHDKKRPHLMMWPFFVSDTVSNKENHLWDASNAC